MASSKIKGINIKIGADTTGLDTALLKIESSGKKASSELRTVNSSLKNNSDSVVLWQQKQELLTTAIESSRQKLTLLENAQEQVKRQFENGEIDGGQYRAFQREIENTRDETSRLEGQLTEANQRIEELGDGLEHSGQQARDSANGGYTILGNVFANVITEGIKLAGTALKNFTQDVIATGTEYEASISNVVAISGAMAEEVELLQSKAEEMGATTKFTAAESAEAMGYMAMAGWKVNDMVSGLDGIMDLSAASGESLASVSDIVTDALTAFGLQASDSAHFADVLAAASSNANTNVAMMGETFKYAAPVAGSFGFSVEDTAEAIGLMANSGIKASQAGTSLRRILTEMSHDIQLDGEKIHQFTVKTSNADGSMRNLSDILADLRVGWEQLSESEQAANATSIVGTNAMSGFLALMNSAPADVEKLSTAIENADGTAKEMSETMLDNLQGDKTLFESAFDGVKIAISKELNPALRDIVQWGTQQMPKVQAVVEPLFKGAINCVKSLINGFEKIKPVLSAVKPMVIAVFANEAIQLFTKSLLPKAIDLLKKIPTPLSLVSNLIKSVADFPANILETLKQIPSVLTSVGNGFKSLWTIISANPYATAFVAATTAGLAVKSYIDNIEIEKTEIELFIEKHNEELQLLADKRQAIRDLNDAFYENVDGIEHQTDHTKDLWSELDKLADQYGNVQQKDQARAEYILNELNNALGTEYTMTGHQIDNYRTLSAEIDNVIAKKQAEMMLDAYLANSTEMTEQRNTARSDYERYDKELKDKQKALERAERQFDIYRDEYMNGSEISAEDYVNGNFTAGEVSTAEGYNIANSILMLREKVQQAENAKTQAKLTYEATSEYFENLEQLQEAYSLGQYDRMAEIIYAEKDLTSTTLDESATDAEQRLEIYSSNLQKTLSDFELAVKDMKQQSVDELEKDFTNLMKYGAVAGIDPLEIWETVIDEATGQTFKDDVLKFQEKWLDISPIIAGLVDSGLRPAQAFDNWQEVFRTQLKNGGDMEAMIRWMDSSEYYNGIKSIFGDNESFIKYMKEQSGKGIDISAMLELGAKSGLAESEEFVKIFKSKVSENLANGWDVGNLLEIGNNAGISCAEEFAEGYGKQMQTLKDNGVDLTEFIQHAEANNKIAAEVLGENFKSELTEYLRTSRESVLEVIKENYLPQIFKKDTLSERLIKGFANGKDISELVKKAEKQGLQVGDVFGDNYTDVIQQQIDKGYSIDELLEWGKESSLSTADMFGDKYTDEVQKFIDKEYSIDSLRAWAERSGYEAGNVFGEKFREISEKYIETQEKIENIRQGIADSGYYGNFFFGNRKMKFMADGGFLSHGQAVVAEAGPELLEVVNGGVRVTPLTQNSRNTAVNSNAGQKIFYSNYTINATIASSYDVSRLAEDLETERRRIEMGMGKI